MKNVALEILKNDETDEYCYLSDREFMDDGSNIDLRVTINRKTV